ncbi:MAG: hypothetical protein QOG42_2666 [Solirubrobacteraceae bacterium]|nr:hypothetical protein [Solirubrobacteraceae bacterium]
MWSAAAGELAQTGPHQRRVQLHGQGGQLADGVLCPRAGVGVALLGHRSDDLAEQAHLTVGGAAERAQVPAFQAEPGHLGHHLGHGKRVVVVTAGRSGRDQAELFELVELVGAETGGMAQFLGGQAQGGRVQAEVVGAGRIGQLQPDGLGHAAGSGRAQTTVDRGQLFLDDPQRQVVLTLLGQDVAQSHHVGVGKLSVARGRPLRLDQALGLEETDLADGDVGEIVLELLEDLTDGQGGPALIRVRRHAGMELLSEVRKTSRNLPIWTSSEPASTAESMRCRLT